MVRSTAAERLGVSRQEVSRRIEEATQWLCRSFSRANDHRTKLVHEAESLPLVVQPSFRVRKRKARRAAA
jgi:hypothetical protein